MATRAHVSENSDPNIQQPASKAPLARKKQRCPAPRSPVPGKGAHRRTHINDDAGAGAGADLGKCREALRASAEEQSKRDVAGLEGSSNRLKMAKTLNTVPDSGAGRVKHLVQAFESLRCSTERLQPPLKEASSSDLVNQLGPSTLCNSLPLDGKSNRSSRDRQTGGGRRSRRNPSESLRSSFKNKRLKVTSQHRPFKLRTEERGRAKVQQLSQKVQEMLIVDKKKPIHTAKPEGIPVTAEVAVPVVGEGASTTDAAPSGFTGLSGIPNTAPLDLFPQGASNAGGADGGGPLDFLRNNQQFQALREMVHTNPQMLQPILQELSKQNPQLWRFIQENNEEFLQLLEGGDGDYLDQPDQDEMPHAISVTPEEQEAIGRLEAMGFDRARVIEAFFACDRNEQLAVNYLLEHAGDED